MKSACRWFFIRLLLYSSGAMSTRRACTMMRRSAVIAGATILGAQSALAAPLVPPDDRDLHRLVQLGEVASRHVVRNHCLANTLRPHVAAAVNYLENMEKWLALARKDGIGQLKNLVATDIRDQDLAATLRWGIEAQEAFLQLSEIVLKSNTLAKSLLDLKNSPRDRREISGTRENRRGQARCGNL